jgi:hypothetical protein
MEQVAQRAASDLLPVNKGCKHHVRHRLLAYCPALTVCQDGTVVFHRALGSERSVHQVNLHFPVYF